MLLKSKLGRVTSGLWLFVALTWISGCGAPKAEFQSNWVYVLSQQKAVGAKIEKSQVRNVANVLAAMFGTPDEPALPALDDVNYVGFMDLDKLTKSAGRVGTDENGRAKGLYRRHCAHCHGVTGDGAGPTAVFLNPYPRDYRMGVFKFKSTPRTEPPTHADLMKILYDGIPGTAMPSFKVFPQDELEALAQYVKYLSIRGQLERALVFEVANELDEGEQLLDMEWKETDPEKFNERMEVVKSYTNDIVQKWMNAKDIVTPLPPRPAALGAAERAEGALREAIRLRSEGTSTEVVLTSAETAVSELLKQLSDRRKADQSQLDKLSAQVREAIGDGRSLQQQQQQIEQELASQRTKESVDEAEIKRLQDLREWLPILYATNTLQSAEPSLSDSLAAIKPLRQAELDRSIEKGRTVFFSKVAACTKCHGTTALGDGQTTDYDDWTKLIEPTKPDAVREYMSLGALKPRNIRPRNLRMGVFRGGRRPIDIFWRIHNGVAGGPMPAASLKKTPEGQGLTTDDVWHLVDYIRNLAFESASQPERFHPTNTDEVR